MHPIRMQRNRITTFVPMKSIEYKGYLFYKDGTVSKDGRIIATNRVYLDGSWHNGIDIANKLFASPVKDKVSSTPAKPRNNTTIAKLPHKLKGIAKSEHTKQLMRLAKQKKITFNGIEYDSINECARLLGVTRQTIYRRLKA